MLKNLFQSRDEKIRLKIEEHITEGLAHLSNRFFNGAMIEFDKAMTYNPEEVYPRLVDELASAAASGQLESALAIGLNLIKQDPDDYELINRLGNYAREGRDYKQANNLYKSALKIKPDFQMAFYNLAASTAKVDIYDDAVLSALSKFDGVAGYILPEYVDNPNIIDELYEKVAEEKEERFQEKLKELTALRDEEKDAGDVAEAKKAEVQINELKASGKKITSDDIIKELKQLLKTEEVNQTAHQINLALYAIQEKNPEIAAEAIKGLSSKDFEQLDLLKVAILEHSGDMNKAIAMLNHMLGKNRHNRYYNANLGLMYQRSGNKFLSIKYLIKTAALLERSNGIYSLTKLREEADTAYDQMQFKKALNYYLVIANETENAEIWEKVGSIYVERKDYDMAIKAFNKMIKLDPDSTSGEAKLKLVQDYYLEKAETLFQERKFKAAAEYYEKALSILRLPDLIKRTAEVYKQLKDTDREQELLNEHKEMMEAEKAQALEETRQQMIIQGKQLLKNKMYTKAIETLEAVFRMKTDRDIFIQLALLYKGMKKQNELISLEQRWQKMLEFEEKMKIHRKKESRSQPTAA